MQVKVLVTGATGFIGKYLLRELRVLKDCEVYAVMRQRKSPKGLCEIERFHDDVAGRSNVNWIVCDLINQKQCEEQLPKKVDVVFHLAAQQPNDDELTLKDYLDGNLLATINLFHTITPLTPIIYASTLADYSFYALSKRLTEKYLLELIPNTNAMVLKFPTVLGLEHRGFCHYLYAQAKLNEPITIYHNPYVNNKKRHVIHVSDAVRALLGIAKAPIGYLGRNRTICAEGGLLLKDYARYFVEKLRSKSEIKLSKARNPTIEGAYPMQLDLFNPLGVLETLDLYVAEMEAKDKT